MDEASVPDAKVGIAAAVRQRQINERVDASGHMATIMASQPSSKTVVP